MIELMSDFERMNGFDQMVSCGCFVFFFGVWMVRIVMTKCSWVFKICGLWLIISLLSVQTKSCRVCELKDKIVKYIRFLSVIEYVR